MSRIVVRVLVVLGVAGAAGLAAQRLGLLPGGAQAGTPAGALPLSCRLKGHGWRAPKSSLQSPTRTTCRRCDQIDLPMP